MAGAEEIYHCAGIRARIYGNGTVHFQMIGLGNSDLIDPSLAQTLATGILDNFTFRTMTKLANFKSERMQLKISTEDIGDLMICSRIIILVKPLWTGYRG